MPLNEMEEFRYTRRKPWLLLVVLAGVALVWWLRVREKPEVAPDREDPIAMVEPLDDATMGRISDPRDTPVSVASTVEPDVPQGAPLSDEALKQLLVRARGAEAADDLSKARDYYLRLLEVAPDRRMREAVERNLGRVSVELITTARPMPEKQDVIVKRGDSLERIARRMGTTVDLIQQANRIENPNLIKAGDHLRVFTGSFSINASKRRNDMVVSLDGRFFKRYDIGSGIHGKTPVGTFMITEKIKEPVWWRPDGSEVPFGNPENILGTRWMTLRAQEGTPDVRGYGIHGTWDEASIGKAESAGCLRMRNADVEELFVYIPLRTIVTIVE